MNSVFTMGGNDIEIFLAAERMDWLPRLAWTAHLVGECVQIRCGSHVEIEGDWIAEAVWDGPFPDGGFDETGNVFGSGVRARNDVVTFVTSASLVDRLWVHRSPEGVSVSNCLAALLALRDDRLRTDVEYGPLNRNRPTEAGEIKDTRPTEQGEIAVVYLRNIRWDGATLRVVPKPTSRESFPDYRAFRNFLREVVRGIGENASHRQRSYPATLLTTISKGYDSPAVSVLAVEAGCRKAVTIENARSVLPRDDSGEEIASTLGLECCSVERGGRGGADELAFWAADGRAHDQNLAAIPYPGEISVLFSGAYGGIMWSLHEHKHPSTADYVDRNTLSFCEYRLTRGVIHCPIPYLGYDNAEDILRISRSDEMQPWSVGGDYDRPIPRRILNEAGIPSSMFARHKSATQFEESFWWPYRKDLQRSYASYVDELGEDVPSVALYRIGNKAYRNVLLPLEERTALSFRQLRQSLERPGSWLFQWSNNVRADRLSKIRNQVRHAGG